LGASVNAVEERQKGKNMISLYWQFGILLFVISSLIAVSFILTSYCYRHSRKQAWYQYLWKGFFLMSIGCILIFLGLTMEIPKTLNLMREVVVLPLGIYGFSLIILGEKKKRGMQTIRKDELTERIARSLSKRPDEEESRLYS
jgi:surface polysaccharide O-acyltransferase-like enzyme